MAMRKIRIILLLLAVMLVLSGCRYMVIETESVRIETPANTPGATD